MRDMRHDPRQAATVMDRIARYLTIASRPAGAAAAAISRCRRSLVAGRQAARVVVIGGGFGGASCARALQQGRSAHRRDAGRGQPDLHRAARSATPCIAGLRDLKHAAIRLRHDPRAGVDVALVGRDRRRSAGAHGDARRRRDARLRPAGAVARHRFPLGRAPRLRRGRCRRSCRMPGRTASRSRCCAGSSKRWTTAAWW